MTDFMLRPMARDDLSHIAAIEREVFAAPWSEEALFSELRNPRSRYVVLEHLGEIAAYAGCWIVFDEAHVNNVAVAPRHRGQGYGERVMRYLAKAVFAEGARSMTLEVRASNAVAKALYTKLGFVFCGVRRKYYSDNQEDAEIMWLNDISPLAEDSLW